MRKLQAVMVIVAFVAVAGWMTGCQKKEKAAAPAAVEKPTEAAPATAAPAAAAPAEAKQ